MSSSPLPFCAPPPSRILNHNNALQRTTAIQLRRSPHVIQCAAAADFQPRQARRSANFQPNLWTDDYIQSLCTSNHAEEDLEDGSVTRINQLKEDALKKLAVHGKINVEEKLRLIDHLQQLGVAYHFKDEIKDALGSVQASLDQNTTADLKKNLHAASLLFRLLRENGFHVSDEILKGFVDENGDLKADEISRSTTRGVLSLYEASFYGKEGELFLDRAMDSTTEHLRRLVGTEGSAADLLEADGHDLREHVAHALELPLNWRAQRLQTRWFIQACERQPTVDPLLLELAKLDFNAVQRIYRGELAEVSRWWKNLDLPGKLPFFRDRFAENYFWTVGWAYEPEHWGYRETITKANCFITMIDDIYDVYGTLDELELFTEAMDRWDVNAIDKLQDYMKICFLGVFNTANEAAYKVMRERGLDIIQHLRRMWADLCKSYLVEAKWYSRGYTPELDEYLDNAWISISGQLVYTQAFCMNSDLTKEALETFSDYPQFARSSSILLRLYDDLATSSAEIERGDVAKSIQCCMREREVSEAEARRHIEEVLIRKYWKQLNGDRSTTCSFEAKIKSLVINVPRMAHFFYGDGDRYGMADGETKQQVLSFLFERFKL